VKTIGTFEGKTHFSALVNAAESGETIVITRGGKPVAQIGPLRDPERAQAQEAMQRILARRIRLGTSARVLIADGRRY
jgi:prevent-host-death family protein